MLVGMTCGLERKKQGCKCMTPSLYSIHDLIITTSPGKVGDSDHNSVVSNKKILRHCQKNTTAFWNGFLSQYHRNTNILLSC